MATPFSWAQISGSSIIGADGGILVKVAGMQTSGSSEMVWDSTNKQLKVSSANSANVALLVETGSIQTADLKSTGEIYVGAYGRALTDVGGMGNGNVMKVTSVEVVPPSYRGLLYGPLEVASGSVLVIGEDAIIAMKELPGDLK